jgi:MFS-type transporter involved in bile tolerance (Atg22 family)
MTQPQGQPQKPASNIYTMGFTPMVVGGEVGCLTLLIVIIALVVGLWLDRTFGTKPMFTIILLLGSAPFSLFLTFWVATRSIKRMTGFQTSEIVQAQPMKEEEISD